MLSSTDVSIDSTRSFPILGLNMGQAASVEIQMLGRFHFSSCSYPKFEPLKQRISLSLNRKLARFIPSANGPDIEALSKDIPGTILKCGKALTGEM